MGANVFLFAGADRFAVTPKNSAFATGLTRPARSLLLASASRLILSCLVVAAIHSLAECAIASDELESIQDGEKAGILQRTRLELKAHAAAFDSADVTWTRQGVMLSEEGLKTLTSARMHWVRSGVRQSLRTEWFGSLDGPRKSHSWHSFDGERSYVLWYHRSDSSKLDTEAISDGEDKILRAVEISQILGWSFTSLPHESVTTMLAKPDAKLHGKRRLHGELCYEIELGSLPQRQNITESRIIMAWIDPQNGWLPRRIQIGPLAQYMSQPGRNGDDTTQGNFWECEIKAFQQVPDASRKEGLYFPKEAEILRTYVSHKITVNSVQSIPGLPDSAFRPEIPDGVKIEDHPNTSRHQTTITGGEQGKAERARILEADRVAAGLEPQPETAASSLPVIDARPKRDLALTMGLLIASAFAFAGATGFAVVKKFRQRA